MRSVAPWCPLDRHIGIKSYKHVQAHLPILCRNKLILWTICGPNQVILQVKPTSLWRHAGSLITVLVSHLPGVPHFLHTLQSISTAVVSFAHPPVVLAATPRVYVSTPQAEPQLHASFLHASSYLGTDEALLALRNHIYCPYW